MTLLFLFFNAHVFVGLSSSYIQSFLLFSSAEIGLKNTENQSDEIVIDFPWAPLLAENVKQKVKRFQILFLFPITLKSGCKEGGRRTHLK